MQRSSSWSATDTDRIADGPLHRLPRDSPAPAIHLSSLQARARCHHTPPARVARRAARRGAPASGCAALQAPFQSALAHTRYASQWAAASRAPVRPSRTRSARSRCACLSVAVARTKRALHAGGMERGSQALHAAAGMGCGAGPQWGRAPAARTCAPPPSDAGRRRARRGAARRRPVWLSSKAFIRA